MSRVDTFVLFDDVNYIKKGFINRNKIWGPNGEIPIRVNIDNASQNRLIMEMDFIRDPKTIKTIEQVYSRSANFKAIIPIIEKLIQAKSGSLIELLSDQIRTIANLLGIETEIRRSSEFVSELSGREKIFFICESVGAKIYKNAPGGVRLYESEDFKQRSIDLVFVNPTDNAFDYSGGIRLSIIDFLMRVPKSEWKQHLEYCEETTL